MDRKQVYHITAVAVVTPADCNIAVRNRCAITRTRQIIRYRATVTRRRPQINNTQPQNRRGLQNQREGHIMLTKYEAVHPTAVSENNS